MSLLLLLARQPATMTLSTSGVGSSTKKIDGSKVLLAVGHGAISLIKFPSRILSISGIGIASKIISPFKTLSTLGVGGASVLRIPNKNFLTSAVQTSFIKKDLNKKFFAGSPARQNVTITQHQGDAAMLMNGKLYSTSFGVASPKLYIWNDPTDLSTFSTVDIVGTSTNSLACMAYDRIANRFYFGVDVVNSFPAEIAVFSYNPGDASVDQNVFFPSDSEIISSNSAIAIDDTCENLYIVTQSIISNSWVYKLGLRGAGSNASIQITNPATGNAFGATNIKISGGNVFVTGNSNTVGWIAKMPADLSSVTQVVNFSSSMNAVDDDHLDIGSYLWFGNESAGANGRLCKVNKSDITDQTYYTTGLGQGIDGFDYDGYFMYVGHSGNPSKIAVVNPSDGSVVKTYSLLSGEQHLNEIFKLEESNAIVGITYESPSHAILLPLEHPVGSSTEINIPAIVKSVSGIGSTATTLSPTRIFSTVGTAALSIVIVTTTLAFLTLSTAGIGTAYIVKSILNNFSTSGVGNSSTIKLGGKIFASVGAGNSVFSNFLSKIFLTIGISASSKLFSLDKSFNAFGSGNAAALRTPAKIFALAAVGSSLVSKSTIHILSTTSVAIVSLIKTPSRFFSVSGVATANFLAIKVFIREFFASGIGSASTIKNLIKLLSASGVGATNKFLSISKTYSVLGIGTTSFVKQPSVHLGTSGVGASTVSLIKISILNLSVMAIGVTEKIISLAKNFFASSSPFSSINNSLIKSYSVNSSSLVTMKNTALKTLSVFAINQVFISLFNMKIFSASGVSFATILKDLTKIFSVVVHPATYIFKSILREFIASAIGSALINLTKDIPIIRGFYRIFMHREGYVRTYVRQLRIDNDITPEGYSSGHKY